MAYEITCNDLGHSECAWKARSNTEDKLVDMVAVHARDHHGIDNFTQEMIADVKNRLGNVAVPPGEEEEPTMKEYHCLRCSWRYIAQTEDLIADAVAVHERDQHNVKEFTEEMIHKVKESLEPWSGS